MHVSLSIKKKKNYYPIKALASEIVVSTMPNLIEKHTKALLSHGMGHVTPIQVQQMKMKIFQHYTLEIRCSNLDEQAIKF